VRVIRSDGGGEFGSGKAKAFYLQTGIQHYTTTRYSPELNGACERMICSIKGMLSSMPADCKLPTEYGSYAARYTAVVIMKTDSAVDGDFVADRWDRFQVSKDRLEANSREANMGIPADGEREAFSLARTNSA